METHKITTKNETLALKDYKLKLSKQKGLSKNSRNYKSSSKSFEKSINLSGTRLSSSQQQLSRSKGLDDYSTNSVVSSLKSSVNGFGEKNEEEEDLNTLVRPPTLIPGVDASPLITWGEMAATPLVISSSSSSSMNQSFQIKERREREMLALKLDKKNLSRKKANVKKNAHSYKHRSRVRSRDKKTPMMSPAATLLAQRMNSKGSLTPLLHSGNSKSGGSKSARRVSQKINKKFSSAALKASYTPLL